MSNVVSHPTLDAATRELLRRRISEARHAREATRVYPRCAGCARDLREDGVTEGCKHCWDREKSKRRRRNKSYVPKAVGARAVCVTCSAEFEAKAPHQRHCSDRCNKRHSWRLRRERARSDPASEAELRRQQRERGRKFRERQRLHAVAVVVECCECGAAFSPKNNSPRARFCCPEHKWAFNWRRKKKEEAA